MSPHPARTSRSTMPSTTWRRCGRPRLSATSRRDPTSCGCVGVDALSSSRSSGSRRARRSSFRTGRGQAGGDPALVAVDSRRYAEGQSVAGTLQRRTTPMAQQPSDRRRRTESSASSRRGFLHQAAGVAAGIAALPVESPAAERGANAERLPTISLGSHQVTRLIIGGNPIYGHSHFNRLLSRHQTDWHTPERVIELLKRCEQCGLNTWQNSYAERTLADLDRYRREGGTMQWLCLGKPDWDQHPDRIDDAAQRKPIGIAPHGALNEKLFRQKKLTVLTDLLKRIRDQGVLVGLSAHDPRLIETAEERGWDVDYYMCCLYYLTRPKDELRRLLGDHLPLGEVYLPSDPPR